MAIRGVLVGVVACLAAAVLAPVGATATPTRPTGPEVLASCDPGPQPYADLPGAVLTAEPHTSKDEEPVGYVMWRGYVPSFDGLPLSVDVTVPCAGSGPHPTVALLHGFTDDKTVWEETGKTDTVVSEDRPGANSRWNEIWFASRGYATLTYTARGWRDSCGPDAPVGSAAACGEHESWIHLDDKRWEVRDAQWLTAGLVQSGIADPEHLAITGGSYGGAPAASAALLAGNVVCGGAPTPPELGEDPCAGKADGALAPWTTPDGETPLDWAASLPLYTFSDLLRVLAPNGRWSDGSVDPAPGGSSTEPFGVPLASTVSGLILAAKAFGQVAPEGSSLDSDIVTTTQRLLAGPPYDPDDPVVAVGIRDYQRFKSPITTEPQGDVPVFLVQGFTDSLFPASEALAMVDHLHASDPDYPVKAFFGDIGHDVAAERQDDWDLVKAQMNDFLDHYLDPQRTPEPPTFDVGASITRCLPADQPQTYLVESSWADLHPDAITLDGADEGFEPVTTSTAELGPSGTATDPISTATLPGPDSYKGCRIVAPAADDPTAANVDFPVDERWTVVGAPTVRLEVATEGADVPIAVRVWDVAGDGSEQALVTRGVRRLEAPSPTGTAVRFQLAPQAYRFQPGHRLRVEVTPNDSPYLLANEEAVDVEVRAIAIELPLHRPRIPASPSAQPGAESDEEDDGLDLGGAVAVVGIIGLGLAIALLATVSVVLVRRARRARTATPDDDEPTEDGPEPDMGGT